MLGLWWWLGCAASDRDVYLSAARDPDPTVAAATCDAIGDGALRGACRTDAASRLAHAGRFKSAVAICEATGHPMWREECWFQAADDAEVVGAEAIDACRHAGRFRENCLGHAIGREVPRVEARFAKPGEEARLVDGVRDVVGRYKPNAPDDQREVTVERMVAQILSKRWEGAAFDASRCGGLRPALCQLAYRMNLDAAPPEVPIEQICVDGPSLERVQAGGAPIWTPNSETVALSVWSVLCDDLATGRVRRDAGHSMGVPPIGAVDPGHLPGQ
jgi:hypothetical protein